MKRKQNKYRRRRKKAQRNALDLKPANNTNDATKLLISYWPLLNAQDLLGAPGECLELDAEAKLKTLWEQLDQTEVPPVAAVLWAGYPFDAPSLDEATIMPIFVMDKAEPIAAHLEEWMEGDTDRFTLHVDDRGDDGYAIMLMPDITKSIERWKLARLIYQEEVVTDNNFNVLYKTIGTCCPQGRTIQKFEMPKETRLGFVESDKIDPAAMGEFDPDNIKVVGPFKVVQEQTEQSKMHLDDLFEGADKPVDPRFQQNG